MTLKKKSIEFQIVIAIDIDDGRLFPLTENIPPCLLPIANQSLLRFQLNALEKCFAKDVLIVTPDNYKDQINASLQDYSSETMKVELVHTDNFQGTADCLRAVATRIRSDFIYISSDTVCQFDFGKLIDHHRSNAADVTIALTGCRVEESEKKGGPKKVQVDQDDQEYIGVFEDTRIVFKEPALDMEKVLEVKKALIHKSSGLSMRIRTDVVDPGVYVFSHWVLELISANPRFNNIRSDLIPFLITRQFQTRQYIDHQIPFLKNQYRSSRGIDRWLAHSKSKSISATIPIADSSLNLKSGSRSGSRLELCDYILQELENAQSKPMYKKQTVNADSDDKDFNDKNADAEIGVEEDYIRCYTYICEYSVGFSGGLLQRLGAVPSYLALNKDIPMQQGPFAARVQGYQKKELSAIGDRCDMGDKSALKQCSVGNNCSIGAKSKLNNCVVMDGVKIAEGCTIQNSVLCAGTVVESNCSLNDCQVAAGAVVPAGSKIKSEVISGAS